MRSFISNIAICFLLGVFSSARAADCGLSSVEEMMTGQEFTAAGLEKLSEQELATLNRWLRIRVGAKSDSCTGSFQAGNAGSDARSMPREDVYTRIVGEFSGFDSRTLIELNNGQVWQPLPQENPWRLPTVQSPRVTLEPGSFGSWEMTIEGYNRSFKVKRVQ